jgi:diguanylate cyclase (GGDEF)-like protein
VQNYAMACTLLSTVAVVLVARLDGGAHSSLSLLFFLPVCYCAVTYDAGHAALCCGASLVAAVVVAEPGLSRGEAVTLFGVLTAAAVLAVAAAANRIRLDTTEHALAARAVELAAIDSLTGCAVRGVFREAVEDAVARAAQTGRPLSLLMIDVDSFKSVNDTYGHRTGDTVLAAVGSVLRHSLRATDLVGRVGGDEFAVLLPDTAAKEAAALANRIRAVIPSGVDIAVTLSIGVSTFDRAMPHADQLFDDADRALYAVKRHGRDGVAVHERPHQRDGEQARDLRAV